MRKRIAVVFNQPVESRYNDTREEKAVVGVLEAVTAVKQSLDELEHEVTVLPLLPPSRTARNKLASLSVDVVFNLFEGFCGAPASEALVPEYLDKVGIPYTGCPAAALRLALDKFKFKKILKSADVPTAGFQVLGPDKLGSFRMKYPCIVKPRGEDASHGISADSVVNDAASLEKQVNHIAAAYHSDALVEEFLTGREFNATVMGNDRLSVLPPSEIVYTLDPGMPPLLTFAAKWEPESAYYQGTKVVCPAEVNRKDLKRIEDLSLAAFRLTGCSGYARVDSRMDENGRLNVIEVNPNPDISPDSGVVRQAAAAGMSFTAFIDRVVNLALEKKNCDRKDTPDVSGRQNGADANTEKYARV